MYDQYGQSTFGADPPLATDSGSQLATSWEMVKLLVPQWAKESVTIAVGVFGGLALFKMFGKKVSAGQ